MASIFTTIARKLETQVTEALTAAGWKQRRFTCAAWGSFYIGKTGNNDGEFIGLWADWKHDGALQLWPLTDSAEHIAQQVQELVANAVYPNIDFLTNSGGESKVDDIPESIMKQVPFEDGPGDVLPYLASINNHYYVVGNLEVNYKSPAWDLMELPSRFYVEKACEQVIAEMRTWSAPGVIVFPADHDVLPYRCVISVAIPVRADNPKIVQERLANTFREYEDFRKVIALATSLE